MKLSNYWLLCFVLCLFIIIDGQLITRQLTDLLTLECDQPLVKLYIFSSQTNPTWKINLTEIYHIKNLANKIMKNSLDNEIIEIKSTTRIMGYQGFSISCLDNNEIFLHGIISIEKQLLESGKSYLSLNIISHVNQYIGQTTYTTNYRNLPSRINCNIVPIKGPDTVPIYNPLTDNGGCFITKQSSNNCYAYATDIVTNTFPQPGRYSGKTPSPITCESVRQASIRDGLVYKGTTFPNDQPKTGHYLALFLWPNIDYHWIRKDANGYWSHKPGPGRVTNRDNRGSLILNPLRGNFTPWTLFCAYYIAQPSKVHIY